ncbi:MAG: hypothetical protein VKM17_01655 [Cyanobacteriota bacterium]|nr:hypothetical protein [Cyanobacteriota bacterium]
MDSLALIVDALVAGAAAAAKDTSTAAIQDSYRGFKNLIQRKLAGHPEATVVLQAHESDPRTHILPLKQKLAEAAVDQDAAILKAAQKLLAEAGALATSGPVINQNINQPKYTAISATGDVSMTFQNREV